MGANDTYGTTADSAESLKVERADLENIVALVRQAPGYFDSLREEGNSFDPESVAFHLQLKGPDLRRRVWAGITSPEGFQWHKEALASKKALGEQLLKDVATFGRALIPWAEDLDKREAQHNGINNCNRVERCIEMNPDVASAAYAAGANVVYISHHADPPQSVLNAVAQAISAFAGALENHGITAHDEMYNLADWVEPTAAQYYQDVETQRAVDYAKIYPVSHAITSTLDKAISNPIVQAALIVLPSAFGDGAPAADSEPPDTTGSGAAERLKYESNPKYSPQGTVIPAKSDITSQTGNFIEPGTATESVDLALKYKPGWTDAQRAEAAAKVKILNDADTIVTQVKRAGTSATSKYRNAGKLVPEDNDVDHRVDLQLGGSHTLSNLWTLDSSVNRSLGAQIQQRIKNLPIGTHINNITIGD